MTSPETVVDEGGTVHYVVTWENTGTEVLAAVDLEAGWVFTLDTFPVLYNAQACASENQGWTLFNDSYTLARRRVGPLFAGQSVSFRLCGVVPRGPLLCRVPEVFRARIPGSDWPEGDLATVRIVHLNRVPCQEGCSLAGNLQCCVAWALQCYLTPQEAECRFLGAQQATRAPARLWSRAVATIGSFFDSFSDMALLYLLRDGPLAATPGGRRATVLYYEHSPELSRLLLSDAALREQTLDLLTAWRPLLDALVDRRGGSARLTVAQVAGLRSLLDGLAAAGSPALRQTIERESRALDLDTLVGLTADQGLKRLDKLTCVPDATTLCLSGGRMRVETAWETGSGQRGAGQAVALTGDTGTFWFFGAANVETIVKVVDACGYNDRRWFFAAGLTDVRVVTTVTDTATGAVKTYTNPRGQRFAPVQDTDAFDCTP